MKRILSFLPLAFVVALAVATPIQYTSIDAPNSRGTMVLNGDFKTYADTKTLTSNFELLRGSITKSASITTGVLSATTASIASMSVSTGAFAVITGTSAAVGSISANTASAASVTVTTATLTRVTASSATFSGIDMPNGLTSGRRTWQVVFSTSVGVANNSIVVSGLNGDTDKVYRIHWNIINGATGTTLYGLKIAGDGTAANYGSQSLNGASTTASAARDTTGSSYGFIIGTPFSSANGNTVTGEAVFYAYSGKNRPITYKYSNTNFGAGANVINNLNERGGSWINSATNISSMTFTTDDGSGFGAGTFIFVEALR